ncbi:UDP-3-O-(3-hydroxymyristoyl)glucosamine N-acyltransferase [Pseudobacter ginsenosidimutans]|jgi:UDP-3-O-[3-hydroxymyristoyl] glucosamine N-acyltransferase|uniref:UDP-3-O-[3-hydroxymyristoyl] glucosamine N-acyltransferase n=1 Tax=Pseudobacter ginsenosidimutans TaxID=661488 RepID=A0A4Q7MTB8_9BACT|nr:UDP-3-O-(3-hydroxymyristoyl)glucosamine N-acyltransferase [Pseudobacter ginsenosidimutans]QEC41143.1 UDP-3-O-(3-hydroxymyristoyl)glucosamine N-acyltransferase [Pseudobacter ginsenosidimutans]RZS72096.1 UDP-3-O-[3-hydroxymyristoyl] glucosamine N-acyltransferase [Pseudobacter ginsenosidimutans]
MKFPSPVSLQWIADLIGARLVGNTTAQATGINEIHRVEPGDLVFVDHPKYYDKCIRSAASFIIINKETSFPAEKALLITDNPFEAYQTIIKHFRPFVSSNKAVSDSAVIGEGSWIAPNAYVGNHVTIGTNCRIHPGVTIMDHCVIGNNVVIQAGSVIGSDAFYYNTKKDREVWYKRMESGGRVVIEDDVEIGAACTIDRGVSHDTLIGRGTKMDNQVHIGHDSVIGPNCLFAAQVGIAGAVEIGAGVILWGQVGVSKTLSIGDNAVVLAQSGVPASLEGGKIYFGTPTADAMEKKKELIWIKRIPEIWAKLNAK